MQESRNSAFFSVGDNLLATLFLVDSEGEPYNLDQEVWDAIRISPPGGDPVEVQTLFAAKTGRPPGLSRARIMFQEPGAYEITGFEDFGLSFEPATIELEHRSQPTVVVSPR